MCLLLFLAIPTKATNTVLLDILRTGEIQAADTIYVDEYYEFSLWIENDILLSAIQLGLQVYSPDGAVWTWNSQPDGYGPDGQGTGGQYVTAVPGSRFDPPDTIWDLSGFFVAEKNMDGDSPDTVFPGGMALWNGLPAGSLEHMISVHFSAIGIVFGQSATICIDSAFVPPAGKFIFVDAAATAISPIVNGPFCFPVLCSDADADGLCNDVDNCPTYYNPDQADADGDGAGDICDSCPNHELDDCCNPTQNNLPPEITSPLSDTINPGHVEILYVASGIDPNCDGTELTFSYENVPSWINVSGDTIMGMPGDCNSPDTSIRLICSDGELADTLEVELLVIISNEAPAITPVGDTVLAPSGQLFAYHPTISDPDDGSHTITYTQYPSWCTAQNDSVTGIAPNTASVEPLTVTAADYCNADTLTFMVQVYLCGDSNGDNVINLGDAVFIISYVFKSGPAPEPLPAGDANCDGEVNVADGVYVINYVFKSGPPPCCP
jgi:hypothetical protein